MHQKPRKVHKSDLEANISELKRDLNKVSRCFYCRESRLKESRMCKIVSRNLESILTCPLSLTHS